MEIWRHSTFKLFKSPIWYFSNTFVQLFSSCGQWIEKLENTTENEGEDLKDYTVMGSISWLLSSSLKKKMSVTK